MGGAKEFEDDFEKLMAPYEEKADRLADESVKRFLARAMAVGITLDQMPATRPRKKEVNSGKGDSASLLGVPERQFPSGSGFKLTHHLSSVVYLFIQVNI
jgi:hypothetical protein